MFCPFFLNFIFEGKSNKNIRHASFFSWLQFCYRVPATWATENESLTTPCKAADVQRHSGTAAWKYPGHKCEEFFIILSAKSLKWGKSIRPNFPIENMLV